MGSAFTRSTAETDVAWVLTAVFHMHQVGLGGGGGGCGGWRNGISEERMAMII